MMYRTELVEGITVENVIEKINAKIEEMEKESYRLVTMSFWGTERAVLVFKKGSKRSLLLHLYLTYSNVNGRMSNCISYFFYGG